MVMSGRSIHIIALFPGQAAVNQYFVQIHVLSLVTDNNPSRFSGRKENDCRNYFMINLHESMGPDRDRRLDLQLDTHLHSDTLPTALRGPAQLKTEVRNEKLSRE